MKIKIAGFSAHGGRTYYHDESSGKNMEEYCGYVRTTEWGEVELAPLNSADVIERQMKQLNTAEAELRSKFQEKLNEIEEARSQLLALTHEVVA